MSDFFDSEIIQNELKEITKLQQSVYVTMLEFSSMSHDERIEHIEMLSVLLEKQKIMYARLSLSDDPEALTMKKHLEKSVELMGFPSGTDISLLFDGMAKTIEKLKRSTDVDWDNIFSYNPINPKKSKLIRGI